MGLKCNTKEMGVKPMEIYIGIYLVILCLAVLVGIIGIFKYQFSLSKEKVDISPSTNTDNKPKNSTHG